MLEYSTVLNTCKEIAFDLHFSRAKTWKKQETNRVLIGFTPIYFPREIIHAVNGLPVGILGAGDLKQIIKGDAYYQSYICHIPRGIIEMVLDDNLNDFDGYLFPSICDVMRNLSGMFQLLKKGKFAKYFDFPQNFLPGIGGEFYRNELQDVLDRIYKINLIKLKPEVLNHSIKLYNKNRTLINEIYSIRHKKPWIISYEQLYYVLRAGLSMPVEEHNVILEKILSHIRVEKGEPMDKIRVVISGSFCEQPPLGLIKNIEAAGCYIVEDDLMLGSRWLEKNIAENTSDPLGAIVESYLKDSSYSSAVYDADNYKEDRLIKIARDCKADGILFAAPCFCDPALLDRPQMQKKCDEEGIRYISFQYSENTGQFKVIKEQVGTFSDSIKLWEDDLVIN